MSSRLARFDRRFAKRVGARQLAGVDEVGRGCLAGPVVVGAVCFAPGVELAGIRDSKQLDAASRERFFHQIVDRAASWSALAVSAREVDRLNVLQASLWGMSRVLRRPAVGADWVLVDGPHLPKDLHIPGRALVKGDNRSQVVAAASIVAKVLRDRLMRAWDRHHPGYGFARHVGYPTPQHLAALAQLGPCPLHRESFAPVRAARAATLALEEEA